MPEPQPLRIGTWNLAGRWSDRHRDLLLRMDCDVLLLTEVRRDVTLLDYGMHATAADMAARRAWAAVLSRRRLSPCPDPHPASALAESGGLVLCSSILPWRGAGGRDVWTGTRHADWTCHTVEALRRQLPVHSIWGGDFNHALTGREWSGSKAGRGHIHQLMSELDLAAATTDLPHRIEGLLSIDHVAIPTTWLVMRRTRHDATGLSDHDAYTVECLRPAQGVG